MDVGYVEKGWDDSVPRSASALSSFDATLIRSTDILVSLFALAFLAPLLVLIGIMVFATDPGPVFFPQKRMGRGGKQFRCLKFRSMVVDAEARLGLLLASDPEALASWTRDHKLKNDPRITRIGNFLRRSSLDELPQLINVLRGEMSLVGPRPIVPGEIPRYGRYFVDYCSIRPGITGLWQVSGRNDVSYRRRVALDVCYARYVTFQLYLRIGLMTVPAVLKARGSY